MRSNIKPENRRLLEAIEYIDGDIVLGVLAGLKDPVENYESGEYKKPSPFKHWRQFTALAACLLLLSAAIPVLNYAVQRFGTGIWEGNAGAGTEGLEVPTVEETQALETEAEIIDFDKALERYADMSAEEIYLDVLKGGWVVCHNGELNAESNWNEFVSKVANYEAHTIFVAEYYDTKPCIFLRKINFDGTAFHIEVKYFCPNENEYTNYTKTLHFLVEKEIVSTNGMKKVWALVDDPSVNYREWLLSTANSDITKHIPWETLFYLY